MPAKSLAPSVAIIGLQAETSAVFEFLAIAAYRVYSFSYQSHLVLVCVGG